MNKQYTNIGESLISYKWMYPLRKSQVEILAYLVSLKVNQKESGGTIN